MFHDRFGGSRSQYSVDGMPLRYSRAELVQVMARMPFFAALSAKDRRSLASVGVERSYPAGANLIAQGQEPGLGLYIVLTGRVRVTQHEDDGTTRELRELGPEEMFGELALLYQQPRSATVTALEPTIALVIPLVDFRAALTHNPNASVKLLAMLAERERGSDQSTT
jgi:CRP-like cAMP-binding protein